MRNKGSNPLFFGYFVLSLISDINQYIMKIKYNRVSTLQTQSGDRFQLDGEQYDQTFFDKCSGTLKMEERPAGGKVMSLITSGEVDELVVEEMSRLGRNAADTLNTIQVCKENNVNIVVRAMGLQSMVGGKWNKMFDMVASILATVAMQERENILERTAQGRAVAISKGVKMGRPAGTNESKKDFLKKYEKSIAYFKLGLSIREVAKTAEIGVSTAQKVKKTAREMGLLEDQ